MGTHCADNAVRRAFAIVAIAVLLAFSHAPAGNGAELTRADNSREITAGELEAALTESSIIAKLAPGDAIDVYGLRIEARTDSTVFLSLSSEYLSAACLAGAISSEPVSAGPGEVIVWHAASRSPKQFSFDIDRFLATTSAPLDQKVMSGLENASETQSRRIFWGLLRPTGVNARAPVMPVIEEVRRAYLMTPTVIDLRRNGGDDQSRLAELVAQSFIAGIAGRQVEPVGDLMSPKLFLDGDRAVDPAALRLLRTRFAESLIAGSLPDSLSGYQLEATTNERQWRVSTPDETYRLKLDKVDGMFFVGAFEPGETVEDTN